MKKGLILNLSAVAILSVSAFGHMNDGDDSKMGMNQQQMMGNGSSNQNMMNGNMGMGNQRMMNQNTNGYGYMMGNGMMGNSMMGGGMMMGHGMMAQMMILPKIMMLNLTDEQQEKISEILSDNKGIENPLDAFTDKGFDEAKYSKAIQKNMDMMGKYCAQRISKIYALLTAEQKKNLKSLIDAQEVMMKNRNSMMNNNMMNR